MRAASSSKNIRSDQNGFCEEGTASRSLSRLPKGRLRPSSTGYGRAGEGVRLESLCRVCPLPDPPQAGEGTEPQRPISMTLRNRLIAVGDHLQRIQLWLAALALMILMMVTVADVFLRYLFNSPVRGS